jgi:hypothetical protein
MGDAQCQVSSSSKKATLADNDLLIMFTRKGSNQETTCSVHHRSTLILWLYGADQEYLTQKINTFISISLRSSSIFLEIIEPLHFTSVIPLLSKPLCALVRTVQITNDLRAQLDVPDQFQLRYIDSYPEI